MSQTISTNFTSDTASKLGKIAEDQNRSCSDLIQEAVDSYLNSFAWLEAKVKEADDSFDAGRFISHDDLKEKYRKLGIKC
jgi:predicted transcriptional regulator